MINKNMMSQFLFCLMLLLFSCLASSQQSIEIVKQKFDQELHDRLPAEILNKGEMVVVDDGTTPPFYLYNNEGVEGASIDLLQGLEEILGIKIKLERAGNLPAMLMGIKSGRYDMSITPIADTLERQKDYDFVDYLQEHVSLVVLAGNPKNIHAYGDLCGKELALQMGGSAERRARTQSELCLKEGKPAIIMSAFKDAAGAFLALKSGRADAYQSMAAIGSYYVAQSKGELELVSVGLRDDFPFPDKTSRMGIVITKDSPLTPIIFAAMQELFNNGTYQAVMKKWSAERNMIEAPGINLVK